MADVPAWIDDELVSLAEFAEVWRPQSTRTAPSTENRRRALAMSRRRDPVFPEPRSTGGRGERFRLGDLNAWAQRRGSHVDLSPAWLARLTARSVARDHGADPVRRFVAGTLLLRRLDGTGLSASATGAGRAAARRLRGDLRDRVASKRLETQLDTALEGGTGAGDLFETVLAAVSPPRTVAATSTPEGLAAVLVAIGRPQAGELVYDPAIGEGTLALRAAQTADGPIRVVGRDTDPAAQDLATARLLVHGVDYEPDQAPTDALSAGSTRVTADLVLLDPPIKGDLTAWAHAAVDNLAPGGRTVVALPFRSLEPASGVWAALPPGAVEAVVVLPDRLRTDTGDPLAVWLLRPGRLDDGTLLIDARQTGSRSGARKTLPGEDVDFIGRTLVDWRHASELSDLGGAARVLRSQEMDQSSGDLRPERWLEAPDRSAALAEALRLSRRLHDLLNSELNPLATAEYRRALGRLERTIERELQAER